MICLEYIKVDEGNINWHKLDLDDLTIDSTGHSDQIKDKYVIISLTEKRYVHKNGEINVVKDYKIQSFISNLIKIPISYNYRFQHNGYGYHNYTINVSCTDDKRAHNHIIDTEILTNLPNYDNHSHYVEIYSYN
jgi:hypothetical protein